MFNQNLVLKLMNKSIPFAGYASQLGARPRGVVTYIHCNHDSIIILIVRTLTSHDNGGLFIIECTLSIALGC